MSESVPIEFFAKLQAAQETHRHNCEVRFVADLKTNAKRTVYLEGVLEQRGRQAYEKLRCDVWALIKSGGTKLNQDELFA